MLRTVSALLVLLGILTGTLGDSFRNPIPAERGGYKIVEADFHVHSCLGDGALSPFGLVVHARRKGLHAIAITDHNQVFAAKWGRWFGNLMGGPTVLVGEEITAPDFHLIGLGLSSRVNWRQSASQAIDEVHRQGGVTVAAHPTRKFWEGFNSEVVKELDGAEVWHPLLYSSRKERGEEIRTFYRNSEANGRRLTPVGSSDYHWFTSLGLGRTYVFVRNNTESEILEALRNGQTVVFDTDGTAYGKGELIKLLQEEPLKGFKLVERHSAGSIIHFVGSSAGWLGLLGLILLGRSKNGRLRSEPV